MVDFICMGKLVLQGAKTENYEIVAAFRGTHVSPAKHSFGKCDRRTDRQTD